jgi:DNA-directed RNA polymerase subunit RPC12/RpoP
MFYHKCGQRLEELERKWKEDYVCSHCGEIVKPYHGHIFNTDTIEYKLEDRIEFSS